MIAERFAPASVNEIAVTLNRCNAEGLAVAIEGGNTLSEMGSPPSGDAKIVTTRLNRIVAHEAQDLTCAVQAGITLAELTRTLEERSQFLPIDAPRVETATIGGTVAAGWLGPRRHYYGRARDYIIGSQVVLADGTIAHAGGMVVKNVSGYDMSKLYVGSFGTLAVITQLNFKALPAPQRRRALIARLPEHSAPKAIAQIAALPIAPAAACCIEGFRKEIDGQDGIDGRLFVLLEGSAALVERATRETRSALGRAGVPQTTIVDEGASASFQRVLDATVANIGERSITYRSLGLPYSAHERAAALRDAANRHAIFTDVLCDILNGDAFVRVSERDSRAFSEKIEACDEDLRGIDRRSTLVAGRAPIRAALASWGEPPPAIQKMRALKTRFDPRSTLNRGRFVGGI